MNKVYPSIFATSFFVFSAAIMFSKSAEAFDVASCVNLKVPDTLDLLKPVDSTLEACIPELKKVNDLSSRVASRINAALSTLSGAEIGNEGKYELSRVTYSIPGKEIKVEGLIQARHVFGEIKEQIPVPVTKYRKEQVPVTVTKYRREKVPVTVMKTQTKRVPYVEMESRCVASFRGRCLQKANVPVDKWRDVKVKVPVVEIQWKDVPYPAVEMQWKDVPYPGVEMQWKTVQPPPLSATCNFTYIYNLSTNESTPTLSCGQGGLGNLTINASAIARVLNGEIPSLGSVLLAVNTTPPGVTEKLDDTYDQIRSQQSGAETGSQTFTYFSSRSFVEWASTKNLAANIVLSAVTGGALSSQLMLELEEKLRSEFVFFSQFAVQTGAEIGLEKFLELATTRSLSIPGFSSVEFNVVNVPVNRIMCVAGTDKCSPPIPEPRIGFAIKLKKT
ncbi:hypothetical protein [Scytonema sp. NUACC26]|uniref:hypothetical protein n=1 Tax=Scytonema sp. NUACC26 TaxID=3140176 RepID=UPI0034DC8E50